MIHINMLTVDAAKFAVCFLIFFTISSVLYDLNKKVILTTADLLNTAFDGEVAEEEEAWCGKCAEKDAGKTD